MAGSAAGRLYPAGCQPPGLGLRPGGATPRPCYCRPREASPHPGVSPRAPPASAAGGGRRTRGRRPGRPLCGTLANPCGNFSGTSSLKCRGTKGSIGHTFMVCIHTENQNQGDFYPFVPLEISVLHEPPLGHLRYGLTDVPPQPNSPPDNVSGPGRPARDLECQKLDERPAPLHRISKKTMGVVVFHWRRGSHLCYTSHVFSQCQTRVKLNRVFFPR